MSCGCTKGLKELIEPDKFKSALERLKLNYGYGNRGWKVVNTDKNSYITTQREFDDYAGVKQFVDKVVGVANKLDHHPTIAFTYNKVKITIHSHSHNGLTTKDLRFAAALK